MINVDKDGDTLELCMYVCKIYLTSIEKTVIIYKIQYIYNTNLNRPRRISFVTS